MENIKILCLSCPAYSVTHDFWPLEQHGVFVDHKTDTGLPFARYNDSLKRLISHIQYGNQKQMPYVKAEYRHVSFALPMKRGDSS